MPNLNEALNITGVKEYQHPLGLGKLQIADSQGVWPPYSAFYLAQDTFPKVKNRVKDCRHQPIIVDVGTGSGILAILAKQMIPEAVCIATDLNPNAVRLAQFNWELNRLSKNDLNGITADGIDEKLMTLLAAQGNADVLIANLPQQPLVDASDLATIRRVNAAAWNIDPSRDPDGLGIFMSVLSKADQIMKPGGIATVSASSKQNIKRITEFLNNLKNLKKIQDWQIVGKKRFDIPPSYDQRLIDHWLAREKQDGVQRLYKGPNGPQYDHYNIIIDY